jgi:hypothetical protein
MSPSRENQVIRGVPHAENHSSAHFQMVCSFAIFTQRRPWLDNNLWRLIWNLREIAVLHYQTNPRWYRVTLPQLERRVWEPSPTSHICRISVTNCVVLFMEAEPRKQNRGTYLVPSPR